jgi:hypothetical protein
MLGFKIGVKSQLKLLLGGDTGRKTMRNRTEEQRHAVDGRSALARSIYWQAKGRRLRGAPNERIPDTLGIRDSFKVVAGTGFEPVTFGL